ncbi:phospho-2-dehydro-3-deoxyheptonate aldolase [Embleya hyalina]|uniref:Phospho-2-dehydro-3-deoxyheptonate aldolase n=1 Tax=Embleya hyalina TaxID=516124 RepID=A0A401YSQ4_9ACTN|nr:phospho-2-dehydro-3-deoxyheptonate aldolase [Embleya hyalina]
MGACSLQSFRITVQVNSETGRPRRIAAAVRVGIQSLEPALTSDLLSILRQPAAQQPDWEDDAQIHSVRQTLTGRPGLVGETDVRTLRRGLAQVSAGAAELIQAGDCAEDPGECGEADVARRIAVLDLLAGAMERLGRRPVVRVGRIAGQFAKPRSRPTEYVGGIELPVYRGHLVNGPKPVAEERRPDPLRLVTGYLAASEIMGHLDRHRAAHPRVPVWTSHEALVLDYELPLVRRTESGDLLLTSTHWPWIGERTRQVDGAHVALLAKVVNPVAVKVGPDIDPAELIELCLRLDPDRTPGRLTLIIRMGADTIAERLPALVRAVRSAGHPVVWLNDPMHGNTVVTERGYKTRYVRTLRREVAAFRAVLAEAGEHPGGVHLETTPDQVTECVFDTWEADRVGEVYTSFCDPRLTVEQALLVLAAWDAEVAPDAWTAAEAGSGSAHQATGGQST